MPSLPDSLPDSLPRIVPLASADFVRFFAYLGEHLRDNGAHDTPLFQPLPRGASVLSAEKLASFRLALQTAPHTPGWRCGWIALDADGIAGHVDLRARAEPHAGHRALLGMGVRRDWRRRGLGRALLATALDWAGGQPQLAWLDLEVLSHNLPARRLYEASGFVQTGALEDLYRIDGASFGQVAMSRALAR